MKQKSLVLILSAIIIVLVGVITYFLIINNGIPTQMTGKQIDSSKVPVGYLIPKDREELLSCVTKEDCAFADSKECCGCLEVINKKYVTYWDSLERKKCENGIACGVCQYYLDDASDKLSAICSENKCSYIVK